MKFDKKVIESVMVAGIALALTITAVTGNGVKAADQVAETQMDKNGMAGVAVAMNAYELEAADMLDSIVSVEKVIPISLQHQQRTQRMYQIHR